jgi:hypothetical protein
VAQAVAHDMTLDQTAGDGPATEVWVSFPLPGGKMAVTGDTGFDSTMAGRVPAARIAWMTATASSAAGSPLMGASAPR